MPSGSSTSVADLGDHQGFFGLRCEAGRPKPCAEIVGPVVGVQLPLEVPPQVGEVPHLPGDRGAGRCGVQAGPDDAVPVAVGTDLPHHVTGPLGPVTTLPHLVVEQAEYLVVIHPRIAASDGHTHQRVSRQGYEVGLRACAGQ
jgi:hypothetical protein